MPAVVKQLQLEETGKKRPRYVSVCSTGTEASGFRTETDFSVSDSDSDDAASTDFTKSTGTQDDDISKQNTEIDNMQESMSFYEQSKRFYLQTDDMSENLGRADTDENLLRTGITLNMSYLHQFEDRNQDREHFYTEFLDKVKLRELLLKNPKKYIKCVIQVEGAHEAYCTPVDAHDSICVIEIAGRSKIGQAFNEDEVVVEILDDQEIKDKRYGKVIGVWNRQRHRNTKHPVFICTLDDMESHLVRPMCKTVPKIHVFNREIKQKFQNEKNRRYKVEIYEYDERAGILCNPQIVDINPAEQGSVIFLVAFINWGTRHIYPRGAIIRRLPCGSNIATGLMVLNLQHEVPTLYKKQTVEHVMSITKRAHDEPSDYLLHDRNDLTYLNTFTIDPAGSEDLDDALSIEEFDEGFKVGVHISDVSAYIPKDTPLDEEAKNRATSFYPGIRKSRNMIPEPLSSNLCSLLQGKIRLTISIFFFLSNTGKPMQMEGNNYEILKSYIRSKRQLTYGQAQTLIRSKGEEKEDKLTKDIKSLFKLAFSIRKNRLGNAMFSMDVDWEETQDDESEGETREAHYLVEEFMIMANRKIAEKLLRSYRDCVPLRCQPPPNKESMDEFFKKSDEYLNILVRLQDQQLGPIRPSVYECLNKQTTKTVMISKQVWEVMSKASKSVSVVECIRKDQIHPFQMIVYQHWLSIQERAGYRCSGSLTGREDGNHFSLNMYPYTHFTSPIRRYNDLVIHRLVHAAVFEKKPSPYSKEEVDSICLHINSVNKRAKSYQKSCRSLQQATELKDNPKMFSCFVDDVSEKGLTLCSPFMKYVHKTNRELTFNRLDMGFKPEVFEDPNTHWNKVKAVWRKRLYNFHVQPNYPPDRGQELRLNPHKDVLFLSLYEWAKIVKFAIDGHTGDLSRAIKNANISHHGEGLDDISTECLDPLQIQPTTRFSMIFSRGQQLRVQMSAAPCKGIIAPKPMVYNMTNNVKFCLQHSENPVLHLHTFATRGTCDQYRSVKMYLERWLPLILMESAVGVVRNEESCTINNVPIRFFGERKGRFALGLAECEVRNIEFSGTASDDECDEDCEEYGGAASYDWLCLKTTVPGTANSKMDTPRQDIENFDSLWVAHAEVSKVVKKKTKQNPGGKLTVSFSLHERAPALPPTFHVTSAEQRFSVEVLRKSEVDRWAICLQRRYDVCQCTFNSVY